jgi:uncharacterized protein YigA (DUF484 family)
MTTMTPEAIAGFLTTHPEFFEQYAEMIADIHIPHPHGGRAISISERQIVALRERSKQLESKLREIIRFGEENDAIGEKVHRLALALLGAHGLDTLTHAVNFHLREDFAVPHVALRAWRADGEAAADSLGPAADALRAFAAALSGPHCGPAATDAAGLFGESSDLLKSYSYIPLRAEQTFGVLALASEDAQRFYPEMGTVYLKRIGEMISVALRPYAESA